MMDRVLESGGHDQNPLMSELFTTLGHSPKAAELGFLIGGRMPVTAYGSLSLGVLTAPTLGEALRFIVDAHHLQAPLINLTYAETSREGRLTIGFRCPVDSAGEALIVTMLAAAIDGEIARRSGRTGNFLRVELTPSSKGHEADYRKWLSLTPHTDGRSNTLVLSRAVLDLPNALADVDTFNDVVSMFIKGTELKVGTTPLQDRAREAVMSNISAPPSQERLAKILGMPPRRLRLHLDRQKTNYQEIIRSCRTEYASTLLRNSSLSLSQIAHRLGYSDLSAFSHSFSRWTGKSPSAFRTGMLSRG